MIVPVMIWLLIVIAGLLALFSGDTATIEPPSGDNRTWDEIAMAYGAE